MDYSNYRISISIFDLYQSRLRNAEKQMNDMDFSKKTNIQITYCPDILSRLDEDEPKAKVFALSKLIGINSEKCLIEAKLSQYREIDMKSFHIDLFRKQ